MSVARSLLSAVLMVVCACGPGQEEWGAELPEAAPGDEASKPLPVAFSPRLDHDVPGKPTSLDSERLHPALAWTVSLTTFPANGVTYPGAPITLTATANQDVGPTPYYIRISEWAGGLIASCGSGTTCTAQVTKGFATDPVIEARIVRSDGTDQQAYDVTRVYWSYGLPKVSATTTLPVGATSTVTATVKWDVGPTSWYIQLFDATTGSRIARCGSGTTCSATVSQAVATTHTFQAFVSTDTTVFPPPNPLESSAKSYVTWTNSGYTISLSSPSWVGAGSLTPITATASVDVGPTPYYITIFRQDTGEKIKSCGSGTTCTVNYYAPLGSTLPYAAFISANSASLLPSDIQASSNVTETFTDNIH